MFRPPAPLTYRGPLEAPCPRPLPLPLPEPASGAELTAAGAELGGGPAEDVATGALDAVAPAEGVAPDDAPRAGPVSAPPDAETDGDGDTDAGVDSAGSPDAGRAPPCRPCRSSSEPPEKATPAITAATETTPTVPTANATRRGRRAARRRLARPPPAPSAPASVTRGNLVVSSYAFCQPCAAAGSAYASYAGAAPSSGRYTFGCTRGIPLSPGLDMAADCRYPWGAWDSGRRYPPKAGVSRGGKHPPGRVGEP